MRPLFFTLALALAAPLPADVVISEIMYHPVERPAFTPAGDPVLDLSDDVLRTVATPVAVKRTEVGGDTTPSDAYAVAIAVATALMFVALLLGAGMLALEREEQQF
jgi:hypothetical protein